MTWSSANNVSNNCSLDNGEEDSYNGAVFASYIIIAILSPVAVAGNAMILAAIWKTAFQRSSCHVLLSGLAFTDLCTGLIAQPFSCASFFLHNTAQQKLVTILRSIGIVSSLYFVSLTLLIMTLMSIERWLHMSRRTLLTGSRRGFVTLTVLLLIPIPLVILSAVAFVKENGEREVNTAVGAFMLLCYLTTSIAYFKIFRIIRQHQQQVQGNQSSQTFGQPAINLAKYKKSVVTILYILALFSCCFLPVIICLVVAAAANVDDLLVLNVAFTLSLVLLFFSSSLNPVLYLWRMNDIRNGAKQLFCTNG